ncbi:MAG: RNA recognition motif domain-containing protein [Flavitalea sp.]
MHIQISNFSNTLTNESLRDLFSAYGDVQSAEISMDAFTGTSRGFGFVEMSDDEQAQKAISALNEKEIDPKKLKVEETQPKQVHKGSYKVGNGAVNVYRFKKN